jgi:hypothetical protein
MFGIPVASTAGYDQTWSAFYTTVRWVASYGCRVLCEA